MALIAFFLQVPASYALAPSNSSLCLVRALSPDLRALKVKTMAIDVFQDTKFSKKYVLSSFPPVTSILKCYH